MGTPWNVLLYYLFLVASVREITPSVTLCTVCSYCDIQLSTVTVVPLLKSRLFSVADRLKRARAIRQIMLVTSAIVPPNQPV